MFSKKTAKKIKRRLIVLAVVAVVVVSAYLWTTRGSIYDFTHLVRRADFGTGTEFTPIPGIAAPAGMVTAADNDILSLFIHTETSAIAVLDKRNGFIWHSMPPDGHSDPLANPFERGVMQSLVGFTYFDERNRQRSEWTFSGSAEHGQFTLESIPNGIRIIYHVGDAALGVDAIPKFLTPERFEERVIALLDDNSDIRFLRGQFTPSRTHEGFMELSDAIRDHAVNSERIIRIFEQIGYTQEELEADSAAANHEIIVADDFFTFQMEFVLQDDTLVMNIPLHEFDSGDNRLASIEFMRYFGAGASNEEGYLFVPSGSGALIHFNNGKTNEEMYRGVVYGLDPILYLDRQQIITPVRMPVLGIKRDNAAMVAWVDSGSALAMINADVAGRNNSFNTAWFSFTIREHTMLAMMGAHSDADMTVVQPIAFDGDITIKYRFLAGDEANYVGMAHGFQRALVERGELTRLSDDMANIPFYLDILGAVERQRFFLGTPYIGIEAMTTYQQAKTIVDRLNEGGVHNIHMRWRGWFNREGLNHHGVRNINWIRAVGNQSDMRALDDLLAAGGGQLYPAVNFQTTNFNSRNINRALEVARDPAGMQGIMSTYRRELARFRNSPYNTGWFLLTNPGVLPFHVDRFIPQFERININALALNDMGNVLTSSMYRRNAVDRESSRMIAMQEMARLSDTFGQLLIVGGNDYSLGAANHLIDIPMGMDRHYILDQEIPFYQIVVHGFIDFAGAPVNSREVQDAQGALLNMLATGSAPHFAWSYAPGSALAFTPFTEFYTVHYKNWIDTAIEQYHTVNDVFRYLRTQRIVGHEILSETANRSVTVTIYEGGTRVYVNTTHTDFETGSFIVPARRYYVVR